ncbi:hypothetical protein [Castellaniella daejeonensis]|uniref:hypothetical protein n=1 Tax=Castellaniella daejeonensis TaxID=659013 RepID=UPI0031E1BE3D
MTMSSVAASRQPWKRWARIAADGLACAAAPVFAVMAVAAMRDASPAMFCAPDPGASPLDGMTTMYLLMSLFHLPPWLRLARAAGRAPTDDRRRMP